MRIGIISRYPKKNEKHSNTSGIASYTKNLVNSFDKLHDICILADKKSEGEIYNEDGNVHVATCWSDLFFPLELLSAIRKFKDKIDVVHIQYDTYLYGNMSVISFPFLLILLRLFRMPIVITMHSMIPLDKINKKFLEENEIKGYSSILKMGYYIVTKTICSLTDKIIVHDDKFREICIKDYNIDDKKIHTVHHGIESQIEKYRKCDTRKFLEIREDKNVILCFGYIVKYKGIDNLIEAFNYLDSDKYLLIIAGGEHPRLKNNDEYKQYILNLKNKAKNLSKNIIFTGFVNENMISTYFSATDVAIFPYTLQVSSSGSLALAIAYEKPFLVSEEFRYIVPIPEIIFRNKPTHIADKIKEFFKNGRTNGTADGYAKKLKDERNWKKIAEKHVCIYDELV